jgi:hypothetical protein
MNRLYPVEVKDGEYLMVTKDDTSPLTSRIGLQAGWEQWKRNTTFSQRAAVVSEILKAQRTGQPQLPIGQSANNQGGLVHRIGQAIEYAGWALTGGVPSNRAFFPPGQSLAPQAPPDAKPRKWDYPFWYNLQIPPRAYESISFDILRCVADTYDLLRIAIESCKNRIAFQDWDIVPSDQTPRRAREARQNLSAAGRKTASIGCAAFSSIQITTTISALGRARDWKTCWSLTRWRFTPNRR